MQPMLKEIVIAGGGSAGWMTAAALSSLLDPKDVTITLVALSSTELAGRGAGRAGWRSAVEMGSTRAGS
jgi:tryptophan halogenase